MYQGWFVPGSMKVGWVRPFSRNSGGRATESSQSNASASPAADFAKVQLLADTQELGVEFDHWVVNPAQLAQFRLVYGNDFQAVLDSYGISMTGSNRVAAGTAYVAESGQVGEVRLEKPLSTETWRENKTQRT